eukprot:gnl/TRDRNA2_/TRDRNA2_190115_c0_seq1.p1 gnl/TRDRNA2_/TRDRNA2_190115_c0~~gnl/TRDRNA2_/TRDRNA2_190115_c0_seq1.p1  ORF type:complete len:396 (+),score=72.72 gnl/TRDRNA2_/TRDRNA2_190115_c0_seq1:63-1250(+)
MDRHLYSYHDEDRPVSPLIKYMDKVATSLGITSERLTVTFLVLAFSTLLYKWYKRMAEFKKEEEAVKAKAAKVPKVGCILITGANDGLGFETCLQLAKYEYPVDKIILACRDKSKAEAAIKQLVRLTGKPASKFQFIQIDLLDIASCKAAAEKLENSSIDRVLLNAGGVGPDPGKRHSSGVLNMFALNVLGHAIFVEGLIQNGKLAPEAKVVFSAADGIIGIDYLAMKKPWFPEFSEDCVMTYCIGTAPAGPFSPLDVESYFAVVKSIGAIYFQALAKEHPKYTFISISPGHCSGTSIAKSMPPMQKICFTIATPILEFYLQKSHTKKEGAARYIQALTGDQKNGTIFCSKEKTMTGPIEDAGATSYIFCNARMQTACLGAVRNFFPQEEEKKKS